MIVYRGTEASTRAGILHTADHGILGGGGVYFTTDKKRAEEYGYDYAGEGNLITAEINLDNPYVVPDNVEIPASIILSSAIYARVQKTQGNPAYYLTKSIATRLKRNGYDGIIWRDEVLVYNKNKVNITDITRVYHPCKMKSKGKE